MPTPYIKKLSKEGKGSIDELEKKWRKAESIASGEGHAYDYGYITTIFKSLVPAAVKPAIISAYEKESLKMTIKINAAFRLRATANDAKLKILNKKLTDARKEVNKSKENSVEFNNAIKLVRSLTNEINDLTDFGGYKSHEDEKFN
jgi:hypothetical protein